QSVVVVTAAMNALADFPGDAFLALGLRRSARHLFGWLRVRFRFGRTGGFDPWFRGGFRRGLRLRFGGRLRLGPGFRFWFGFGLRLGFGLCFRLRFGLGFGFRLGFGLGLRLRFGFRLSHLRRWCRRCRIGRQRQRHGLLTTLNAHATAGQGERIHRHQQAAVNQDREGPTNDQSYTSPHGVFSLWVTKRTSSTPRSRSLPRFSRNTLSGTPASASRRTSGNVVSCPPSAAGAAGISAAPFAAALSAASFSRSA